MEANQYAISAAELQRISSAARSELSSLVACQTRKLLVNAAKQGHTRTVLTLPTDYQLPADPEITLDTLKLLICLYLDANHLAHQVSAVWVPHLHYIGILVSWMPELELTHFE